MVATTVFLEAEEKVRTSAVAGIGLGESTKAIRNRGAALWRDRSKEVTAESGIAIAGYGQGFAD